MHESNPWICSSKPFRGQHTHTSLRLKLLVTHVPYLAGLIYQGPDSCVITERILIQPKSDQMINWSPKLTFIWGIKYSRGRNLAYLDVSVSIPLVVWWCGGNTGDITHHAFSGLSAHMLLKIFVVGGSRWDFPFGGTPSLWAEWKENTWYFYT